MTERRYNADVPLGAQLRSRVEELKLVDRAARDLFERVRDQQLVRHPPLEGESHTPAQRANAAHMANKAVAMTFLDWP